MKEKLPKNILIPFLFGIAFCLFLILANNANLFSDNVYLNIFAILLGIVVLYGSLSGVIKNHNNLFLGIGGFHFGRFLLLFIFLLAGFIYQRFFRTETPDYKSLLEKENIILKTEANLRIISFSFLREIFEKTGKKYLIYQIYDHDTNQDKKIDDADINSLYMSKVSGEDFRKIFPVNQELIDWKVISILNRLYFRSIEDINRNGKFEKEDQLHYFYLDFNTDYLAVEEYFPG